MIRAPLVVGSLTAQLRDTLPFWEVLMALFFIAIVLVFPRGIAGLADPLLRYFPARKRQKAALAAPGDAAVRPPAKLALDGVSVHVGEVTILDKLSVDFDHGRDFSVIGPNGAGKTLEFNVVGGELSTSVRRDRSSPAAEDRRFDAQSRVSSRCRQHSCKTTERLCRSVDRRQSRRRAMEQSRQRARLALIRRLRRWTRPMLKELAIALPLRFWPASARKAAELSHSELKQILGTPCSF